MLLVGCAVGLRERYRVRRAQAAALACETRTEMCVCSDEVRPAVSGRPIRWSIPSPLKCKTQCLTFERGLNAYIREGCVLHLRGRTHDASRMYRYSRTVPVPVPYLLECVTWGCMSVMTPPGTPPSDCILFLACLSPSNCRTHDACDLGGGQLLWPALWPVPQYSTGTGTSTTGSVSYI